MRAVNLLPNQASNAKFALDRVLVIAIGLTVLVIAAVGGGYYLEKSNAASAQQQLATAQAALAQAEARAAAHPATARLQIPAVLAQQGPWTVAVNTALSTRMPWDMLLTQLESVVPARVVLTTLSFGSAGSPSGFTPTGYGSTTGAPTTTLSIGGKAFTEHDVAVFMSTLARVPRIVDVSIVSTGVDDSGTVNFQIAAHVALPVGITPPAPTTTPTTTTGAP